MSNFYLDESSRTSSTILASVIIAGLGVAAVNLADVSAYQPVAVSSVYLEQTSQTPRFGFESQQQSMEQVDQEILSFFAGMLASQQPRDELDAAISDNLWDLYD